MATINFRDRTFKCEPSQTVLDVLLENNQDVPYSCQSGVCHTCIMRATKGKIPPAAQNGLKEDYIQQGLFLPCQCFPNDDLTVQLPHESVLNIPARIIHKELLNPNILKVILDLKEPFQARPGQYIQLVLTPLDIRSYSIAHMDEKTIELHIRHIPNGRVTSQLFSDMSLPFDCAIRGPLGDCYYDQSQPNDTLVLAGTGTGLAPLWGILNDAFNHNHAGKIILLHGAQNYDDLYLQNELIALTKKQSNFHYFPCVSTPSQAYEHIQVDRIENVLKDQLKNGPHKTTKVYLCGNEAIVNTMKKTAFLEGISHQHIFSDAFILQK